MRRALSVVIVLLPVLAGAQESVVGQFDALLPRRDDPAVVKQMHRLLDQGLKQNPGDYAILWRAAQLIQWEADGAADSEHKRAYGKHCWEFADRAREKDPSKIEGHYFGAACIGAYSEGVGILTALGMGLEGKFNERLDKAISMNPRFLHCAPMLAKGRYFFELPWPKRNLDKSAEWYQRAISGCPESLRAYLWLAETQLEQDHAPQAKATLQKALSGSIDYDPPEGRRAKGWAATLEKKIEEKEHK